MPALPITNIPLNGGSSIPQLGLGVYQVPPPATEELVRAALEVGYRHFDTATLYGNEAEVGRAVISSGIPREDMFVTTKLWNTDQPRPRGAFEESLDRLGLDRVDLYLIHWPQPMFGDALGAWRALIDIAESGRATAIGVSNFEIEHLQELIDHTGVVPAVNQIELHPLHQRSELTAFCVEQGIAIEAWAPLARGNSGLLAESAIVDAAQHHGKTPAQVVLRWHLQRGRIVFPKTSQVQRLQENADIFDFDLTTNELDAVDALNVNKNFGPDPRVFDAR